MRETRYLYMEKRRREELLSVAATEMITYVSPRELKKFASLLSSEKIAHLLKKDRVYTYVDNYLLAVVFVYFKRAGLSLKEYNQENFFLCLYLAHDMEEDYEQLKWDLLLWALGEDWWENRHTFLLAKDQLWSRMGHRSVVSRKQCRQIMKLSLSRGVKIWTRRRKAGHAGALRKSREEEHQPLQPSQDIWSGDKEVKVEVKMSELVIMDEPKEEVEVLVSKYTTIKPIHYY